MEKSGGPYDAEIHSYGTPAVRSEPSFSTRRQHRTPTPRRGRPMNEERLQNLLLAWQEEQARGRDVPAAELCRDCPDLADELNERIAVLRRMNGLLQPGGDAEATPSAGGRIPPK